MGDTVLLCGCSPAERRLAYILRTFGSTWYSPGRQMDANTALTVRESVLFPRKCPDEGILVLGSHLQKKPFPLPEQLIPVFDSANTRAVHLLSRASRSGLSFGCAPQDTLSLASLSDSQAVVSLQRTLITLHGHVLEPRDLTVRLRGSCELFELMAVCAILLLCERIPDGQISIPFAF